MADFDSLARDSCRPGAPALSDEQARDLLAALPAGWTIENGRLCRRQKTRDFAAAFALAACAARIAEEQNHHPDIECGWGYARLFFYTHSARALTRNDFICAAKIEAAQTQAQSE